MNHLTPDHRIALLMHDGTDNTGGKTGLAILRYSPLNIVAVIDQQPGGEDLAQITGIHRAVPIVASVQAAMAYRTDGARDRHCPLGRCPARTLVSGGENGSGGRSFHC
jgi:hypothetical protein